VRVVWSWKSRADLARIHEFNAEWSDSWASRVDARLFDRADALGTTPFIGRPADAHGKRFLSVPDIQYVILYEVAADQVTILRVHSTRESRDEE
jgi:toxin ParE1/3/4